MNSISQKGLSKHVDFILLDILCLQLCFVLSYWVKNGYGNPYENQTYQYQALVLQMSQLIIILFANNYQGILRRKRFDELVAVLKFTLEILIIALVYLFLIHRTGVVSRLQYGFTSVSFLLLDYLLRQLNKRRILSGSGSNGRRRSIVLITSSKLVNDAMEKLSADGAGQDYFICGIVLMDTSDTAGFEKFDIPVLAMGPDAVERITHGWVDEAFILQPDYMPFPSELMDNLMEMGIPVNYSMSSMEYDRWPITDVKKLGEYRVFTSSLRSAPAGQIALKRIADIVGGFVGCIATAIVYLFVAPAIYSKSPGPIFFSQDRVGKNGKIFKMYKFRSMYMDAEERKAALMAQNKIQDGMMFKIDDDPRIIGSEKKGKDGKPKGIGNFIRNTSLDEFPQFFNILKGDMSLVGTRPPTLDEWKKYDLGHRIRMSIKPGLTGMWQVSGRSSITSFEEVVRLDRDYIENWSLALDVKIMLKTVGVVLAHRGAV